MLAGPASGRYEASYRVPGPASGRYEASYRVPGPASGRYEASDRVSKQTKTKKRKHGGKMCSQDVITWARP
jgi:hypothetical protein